MLPARFSAFSIDAWNSAIVARICLVHGLNGGIKNELVHRDQGECRIVRLEKEIVTRRDFRDEPL